MNLLKVAGNSVSSSFHGMIVVCLTARLFRDIPHPRKNVGMINLPPLPQMLDCMLIFRLLRNWLTIRVEGGVPGFGSADEMDDLDVLAESESK